MIDSVIDTCERYWNDCKQKGSRKDKIPEGTIQETEKKRSKRRQSSKDSAIENDIAAKNSPVRRKHDSNKSPELKVFKVPVFKRRKTNDVTDSGVALNICKTG